MNLYFEEYIMVNIRYVHAKDKKFWFSLDKHLSE